MLRSKVLQSIGPSDPIKGRKIFWPWKKHDTHILWAFWRCCGSRNTENRGTSHQRNSSELNWNYCDEFYRLRIFAVTNWHRPSFFTDEFHGTNFAWWIFMNITDINANIEFFISSCISESWFFYPLLVILESLSYLKFSKNQKFT